jgi:hypothetical protein
MKSKPEKLRILVGGMVGQYPLGGVAWDYFHYVLGLAELGHEVCYYEDTWSWPYDPRLGYINDDPSYTVDFISRFFTDHASHLSANWCYIHLHDKCFGMTRQQIDEAARHCDIFLNVSGSCFFPDALSSGAIKVFLDTDPGYNQIMLHEKFAWSPNVERWCRQVREHDRHLTYAENLYASDCNLPRMDFDWRVTRPLVTLGNWARLRNSPPPTNAPFTTVMSWNYYGDLIWQGVKYDAKVPEYNRFKDLPRRTRHPLLLAASGQKMEPDKIRADGWNWVNATEVSITPEKYMQFIEHSSGEWSIAKNVYVATNTGWFSCRTACYLAAARPAVVQDTAWSRYVPSGEGVIAFSTIDQALAGLDAIASDPARHRAAAYEIAREYLAADRVLPPMIEAIHATSAAAASRPPGSIGAADEH